MKKNRLRRGSSLVEVTLASSLTMIVLMSSIATFLLGMSSWLKGQGKIDAEGGSQRAVRMISEELREARGVTIDANGQGLTYQLPTVDGSGNYVSPVTYDGVVRRIELQGSNLVVTRPGNTRIVCKGVITTDPLSTGGAVPYKIFTPGLGTMTRSLTVMVVSSRNSYKTEAAVSRSRETVYLRNIRIITK